MKITRKLLAVMLIITMLLTMLSVNVFADIPMNPTDVVTFTDPNLTTAITTWVGKNPGDTIYVSDLSSHLTAPTWFKLDLTNKGITNLSGMEAFNTLNLQWLILDSNTITDLTPISGITALKKLSVDDNKLASLAPVSSLTNLNEIYFANFGANHNTISDLSPLSSLPLTIIYGFRNSISNIAPLSSITTLTTLDLDNNTISNLAPLNGLPNLAQVFLNNNNISDLSTINNLPSLYRLNMQWNQYNDISTLSNFPNLTDLKIGYSNITDISPIGTLTKLQQLDMPQCNISDISSLAPLTKLERLDLHNNKVNDISIVANNPNLSDLQIDSNRVTDLTPVSGLNFSNGSFGLSIQYNYIDVFDAGAQKTTYDAVGKKFRGPDQYKLILGSVSDITAGNNATVSASIQRTTDGTTFTTTSPNITPSDYNMTFASSNNAIATVNNNGVITGVSAGTVNITGYLFGINSTYTKYTVSVNITSPTSGTIHGTVTNSSNGSPIQGALVDAGGGHTTTTNASGQYSLTNLPFNTYTVTASKSGFTSNSGSTTISVGTPSQTLDLQLTPAAGTGRIDVTEHRRSPWNSFTNTSYSLTNLALTDNVVSLTTYPNYHVARAEIFPNVQIPVTSNTVTVSLSAGHQTESLDVYYDIDDTNYEIKVRVIDNSTNQPIQNVTVGYGDDGQMTLNHSGTTDVNGEVLITGTLNYANFFNQNIPYNITANIPGYHNYAASIVTNLLDKNKVQASTSTQTSKPFNSINTGYISQVQVEFNQTGSPDTPNAEVIMKIDKITPNVKIDSITRSAEYNFSPDPPSWSNWDPIVAQSNDTSKSTDTPVTITAPAVPAAYKLVKAKLYAATQQGGYKYELLDTQDLSGGGNSITFTIPSNGVYCVGSDHVVYDPEYYVIFIYKVVGTINIRYEDKDGNLLTQSAITTEAYDDLYNSFYPMVNTTSKKALYKVTALDYKPACTEKMEYDTVSFVFTDRNSDGIDDGYVYKVYSDFFKTYSTANSKTYLLNDGETATKYAVLTENSPSATVTFRVKEDVKGSVTVEHRERGTNNLLATSTLSNQSMGAVTVWNQFVPGYNLDDSFSKTVTLTEAQPNQTVVFYYLPITTGNIFGVVVDNDTGDPIENSTVNYTGAATGTTSTDAGGNFGIFNTAVGSYTLTASASGYDTNSANTSISNVSNWAFVEIRLTKTVLGSITVNCVDEHGAVLQTNTLSNQSMGAHVVNSVSIPGYVLNDSANKTVTLTVGQPNQTVTFNYIVEPPILGSITVNYVDQNGASLGTDTYSNLSMGSHDVNAKSFAGYTLNDTATKTVTLTAGNRDQTITFTYKAVIKGSITANYVDENGASLGSDVYSNLDMGSHSVNAKSISGYGLNDTSPKTITLTEASPNQSVTFTYKKDVPTPPSGGGGDGEEAKNYGVIQGTVRKSDGSAVQGAKVVAIDGNLKTFITETDENGHYHFDQLSYGQYVMVLKTEDTFVIKMIIVK